ncbi:hypothetical protein [Pelomonas cellulosilytica]|uniref:Uncharacterized protein n=1 Tax=Pelomonas cellulosilytica TaxID=2906762 RepID=A0ABS8XP07_9BURK|nr:hypothetical protein [Pelomonas sp. P8]MCE4554494.1 hypothetical protein [Pelomonas sp. P8]
MKIPLLPLAALFLFTPGLALAKKAASSAPAASAPVAASAAQSAQQESNVLMLLAALGVGALVLWFGSKIVWFFIRRLVAVALAPFSALIPAPTVLYSNAPAEAPTNFAKQLANLRFGPGRHQLYLHFGNASHRTRFDTRLDEMGARSGNSYFLSPKKLAKVFAKAVTSSSPGIIGTHMAVIRFRRGYLGLFGKLRSEYQHWAGLDHEIYLFAGGTAVELDEIAADVNRTLMRMAQQGIFPINNPPQVSWGETATINSRADLVTAAHSGLVQVMDWTKVTRSAKAIGDSEISSAVAAGVLPTAMTLDSLVRHAQIEVPGFDPASTVFDEYPLGHVNPTTGLPMLPNAPVDVHGTMFMVENAVDHHAG